MATKPVTDHQQTIDIINGLIETCRDGQNGYVESAEKLEHPELRKFFLEQSQMRARFVGQLQEEVRSLGGDPENAGTTSAAIHRAWINLKSALTSGDSAILAAAETGEDHAVNAYREALKNHLPNNVSTVVEAQFANIKKAHDTVRDLRDKNVK
jgi:uncharacterized protein (TIGR02284 family)